MRRLVQIVLFPLPWTVRRWLLGKLFGYDLHRTARIGFSVLDVDMVRMGPGARIGHLTFAKGLTLIEIGAGGILGNLNWVTAYPLKQHDFFAHRGDRKTELIIAHDAAITARHFIDCTDRITIGEFATVAGWHSQIVTHSFDLTHPRQDCEPIAVGAYSFVGSRAILLKGAHVPERSIVAAGSTFGVRNGEPLGVFAGNPAARIREADPALGYFTRDRGLIN
jgi:acetyltransferase-like isoleucine patch superfamily enzyme